VLLEAAREGIDPADIRVHLAETEHVHDVRDLHLWTLTSNLPTLSGHVVIDDSCFQDGHAPRILDQLQDCLAGHFDVEHSTFQLELASHGTHEHPTHDRLAPHRRLAARQAANGAQRSRPNQPTLLGAGSVSVRQVRLAGDRVSRFLWGVRCCTVR
jgi:hypothetical protein